MQNAHSLHVLRTWHFSAVAAYFTNDVEYVCLGGTSTCCNYLTRVGGRSRDHDTVPKLSSHTKRTDAWQHPPRPVDTRSGSAGWQVPASTGSAHGRRQPSVPPQRGVPSRLRHGHVPSPASPTAVAAVRSLRQQGGANERRRAPASRMPRASSGIAHAAANDRAGVAFSTSALTGHTRGNR